MFGQEIHDRWRAFLGPRDEVLAHVPDEQFADAAQGVFTDVDPTEDAARV